MTDAAPAKKAKKPAKKAEHPAYATMIAAAITGLKEKSGSSRKAILNYILANYKVGDNKEKVQNRVRLAVKRMAAAKKVKKVKKPKAKKPKAKKAKKPAKKAAPKKKAAKKPAKKAAPKKK